MAEVMADDGPLLLRVIITTLVLGGVFILARTITRTMIRPQFGWDDALIIITWFIILGYNSAMFVSISRGYGKHKADLTDEQYVSTVKAEVIGQVMAIASYPTGKASVAALLLRVFPDKKLRWGLWTLVIWNAVFFYTDAMFVILQCHPVAFQWDHTIEGGACWNPKFIVIWGYITGVSGCFTDFALALLPWYYISKLQMTFKTKLGVGAALSLGLFAGACSIIKIYCTSELGVHSDYTFDTVPLVIWSCLELGAINIAACIPTLGPFVAFTADLKTKYFSSGRSNSIPSSENTLCPPPKRFRFRNPDDSLLKSTMSETDRKIYQSRSYEVTVNCGDSSSQSDTELGNRPCRTSVVSEVPQV